MEWNDPFVGTVPKCFHFRRFPLWGERSPVLHWKHKASQQGCRRCSESVRPIKSFPDSSSLTPSHPFLFSLTLSLVGGSMPSISPHFAPMISRYVTWSHDLLLSSSHCDIYHSSQAGGLPSHCHSVYFLKVSFTSCHLICFSRKQPNSSTCPAQETHHFNSAEPESGVENSPVLVGEQ